jgi:hypothetical protein
LKPEQEAKTIESRGGRYILRREQRISVFQGSQAVPVRPPDKGTLERVKRWEMQRVRRYEMQFAVSGNYLSKSVTAYELHFEMCIGNGVLG